jgi:hypothetical protein
MILILEMSLAFIADFRSIAPDCKIIHVRRFVFYINLIIFATCSARSVFFNHEPAIFLFRPAAGTYWDLLAIFANNFELLVIV